MELADFLLARIAEDEDVARRSIEDDTRMTAEAGPIENPGPAYVTEQASVGMEYLVGVRPARVLAECEAKRQVVTQAAHYTDVLYDPAAQVYRQVLRALALPYAGHPDYRPQWAPVTA